MKNQVAMNRGSIHYIQAKKQQEELEIEEEELSRRLSFSLFDKDGDGEIGIRDLQETLQSMGHFVDRAQIEELIRDMSSHSLRTSLSYLDYCALLSSPCPENNLSAMINDSFRKRYKTNSFINNNRNGHSLGVTADISMRPHLTPEQIQEYMVKQYMKRAKGKKTGIRKLLRNIYKWIKKITGCKGKQASCRLRLLKSRVHPTGLHDDDDRSCFYHRNSSLVSPRNQYDQQQLQELLLVFQAFDTNNDAVVSFNDIRNVFSKLGLSSAIDEDEIRKLPGLIGLAESKNPVLTFPQFVQLFHLC